MSPRVAPATPEDESPALNAGEEEDAAPKAWIHTMQAEMFFGAWILLNALILAIETDHRDDDDNAWYWILIESIFNVVFLAEMIMRIVAEKARWPLSAWNIFDAVLVVIGIVDVWILFPVGSDADIRFLTLMRLFRLLRLMRVLRVLRLMRNAKELMLLISGMLGAFKAMIWGTILLVILIFISALLTTRIVGKQCCFGEKVFSDDVAFAPEIDPDTGAEIENENAGFYFDHFGTMPRSMFTLFQFTMEFQPDICRATWADDWWGYLFTFFLIGYTMLSNLVILNIIASVIVEVILEISGDDRDEEKAEEKENQLQEIQQTVDEMFKNLDLSSDRRLEYKELASERGKKVLKSAGLVPSDAKELFDMLDRDESGTIDPIEFKDGLLRLKQPPDPKDIMRIEKSLGVMEKKVDEFMAAQDKVLEKLENKVLEKP